MFRNEDIDKLINTFSLKEKIGQLLVIGLSENTVSENVKKIITEIKPSGLYVSHANFPTLKKAYSFIKEVQKLALKERPYLPLLICTDHEGSWSLSQSYLTTGPGNMALGATYDSELVYRMYFAFGSELKIIGVNVDLAPVADVNLNPFNPIIGTRSFGENPEDVSNYVEAAIKGLHDAGLLACAKHFPGHGDVNFDSHKGLFTITKKLDELWHFDLKPFIKAINTKVDMIMTSHIIFNCLDPFNPASLSEKVTDFLRKNCNFDGIIMTDSLNMGAIIKKYSIADAAIKAIRAGANLLLFAQEIYDTRLVEDYNFYNELVFNLEGIIKDNEVIERLIDNSLTKILRIRSKLSIQMTFDFSTYKKVRHDNKKLAYEVAAHSITLVKNNDVIPLNTHTHIAIVNPVTPEDYALLGRTRGIGPNLEFFFPFKFFVHECLKKNPYVYEFWINRHTPKKDRILSLIKKVADAVIVVTEKYPLPGYDFDEKGQIMVIKLIKKEVQKPLIIVALRDPYELLALNEDDFDCYLVTYGARKEQIIHAVNVLFGLEKPLGRLPVSIPSKYAIGHHVSL